MKENLIVDEDGVPLLSAQGYVALTEQYILPEEEEILERAIAQLEKNSRAYLLVKHEVGVAIWVKERFVLGEPRKAGAAQ